MPLNLVLWSCRKIIHGEWRIIHVFGWTMRIVLWTNNIMINNSKERLLKSFTLKLKWKKTKSYCFCTWSQNAGFISHTVRYKVLMPITIISWPTYAKVVEKQSSYWILWVSEAVHPSFRAFHWVCWHFNGWKRLAWVHFAINNLCIKMVRGSSNGYDG